MLSTRTYKAYALVIFLLCAWTLCGVLMALFMFPDALTTSDEDRPPRDVLIRSTTDPASPYWGVAR